MKRVVIQAGGKGTRLAPYTTVLPKPLMPINDYPILEIVIRQLAHHGFTDITITIGHLGHLIEAVIGDGSRWGVRVDYSREKSPRGTIGAVSGLDRLDEPFLVMNGDLLTDFPYREFYDAHLASHAALSVGLYNKKVGISLGVFDLDDNHAVVGFREKPVLTFPCSMGIYVLDPKMLDLVPETGVFGFDNLMEVCLREEIPVRGHPFDGVWLDIGLPEDYQNASRLFEQYKERILPPAGRPRHHVRAVGAGV